MSYEYFTLEKNGHVAVVSFNRPDKMNALSADVLEELEHVAHSFRSDGETRAVVFRGEGRHFSSGADLTDPKAAERAALPLVVRRRNLRLGQRVLRALLEMDQITIAAMHGGALGGGACIATAVDFRVGSESCWVCYPEINLGINLQWIGLPLCVHLVGPSRAKRLVILGERETAQTLLQWGFLDEVVPDGQELDRALEMARAYAAQPPVPAQMIKRSVNKIVGALDEAVMHMDFDQWQLAALTEDAATAREHFREEEKPEFKGS